MSKVSKKATKRAEITDKLAEHFLASGLADTGLRRLADVSGTSDRMLLYYFENKDELVSEVLMQIAAELTVTLDETFGSEALSPVVALSSIWELTKSEAFANHTRLFFDLSSRAGRGDVALARAVFLMSDGWISWLSGLLDVSADHQRATASLILGAVDGQLVLFPSDLSLGDPAVALLKDLLEKSDLGHC